MPERGGVEPLRTERGAGDELAGVADAEASFLAPESGPFDCFCVEGVPERLTAVAAAASVLRFFAGGPLLTVLAVPFLPEADFGGGRFRGTDEDGAGLLEATGMSGVSVD